MPPIEHTAKDIAHAPADAGLTVDGADEGARSAATPVQQDTLGAEDFRRKPDPERTLESAAVPAHPPANGTEPKDRTLADPVKRAAENEPRDQTLADPVNRAKPGKTLGAGERTSDDDHTGEWQQGEARPAGANDHDTARVGRGADRGTVLDKKGRRVQVPGYEILGELGRGGMGVVYKARQLGLKRIVALKMVLAGSHASAEQLARFRIEAEAVAHLQHPNIVQVYETGEHEGCPFFSLEYVDGPSLFKQIDGTPQAPRDAARLIRLLADAMHAAHQRGIIHRDLKPANILLARGARDEGRGAGDEGREARGERRGAREDGTGGTDSLNDFIPKITDFGLAKRFEDAGEGHTRTGAIMGTPSYMAPEQAQGRTKETGPPADIYSLGAMLYDLLTGRPPFRGATLLDTLQQVQAVEPVPPARLQPTVPSDLETICLKALEKDPRKRYASAGALAEDLRRFLENEPILARPTPWWERSIKWARRRPALASLISVSTAAAISLLVLGGLWLDSERRAAGERERQQIKLAASERQRAEKEEQLRHLAQEEEKKARERARERAEQAAREKSLRQRAETNFLRAKKAVDLMLSRVGQDTLAHVPQMTAIRRELLEGALGFYEEFRKEETDDAAIRREAGRAQQRVADIYYKLGRPADATKAYQQALDYFSDLSRKNPGRLEYRKDLAGSYNNFGNLLRDTRQTHKAEQFYREAMKLRQELFEAAPTLPEHAQELAESFNNLGNVLQTLGKGTDADPAYERGSLLLRKLAGDFPKKPRYREELARTLTNRGVLLKRLGKAGGAEKCLTEARDFLARLTTEQRDVPEYRRQHALALNHLGDLWRDTRTKDAEHAYHKALDERRQLTRDFPGVPGYAGDWAMSYDSLATLLQALGRDKEADKAQQQALAIRTQIAADFPTLPEFKRKLAAGLTNRGIALFRQSRLKDAEEAFEHALALCRDLTKNYPDSAGYQQELAGALFNLALLAQATGRGDNGAELLGQALRHYLDLARRFPEVPEHQQQLAEAYLNRGVFLQARNQPAEVEKSFAQAAATFADLAAQFPDNPDYRHELAASRTNHGNALRALGRSKAAEEAWQSARDLLTALAKDFPLVPTYRRELAQNLNELGIYLVGTKRNADAEKAWNEALALRQKLFKDFPEQPDYRLDLARSHGNLGILLARTNRLAEAQKSFRAGVALLEEWERKLPVTPAYSQELIRQYRNLAELHAGLNRPAEAEKGLQRVLTLQRKLVEAFPDAPEFRYDLSRSLNDLGTQLLKREKFAEARPHLESAADQLTAVLKKNDKDAYARHALYFTYLNLATAWQGLGDYRQAAKTVSASTALAPEQQPFYERFAAILAGCSALAKKDGRLSAMESGKLAQSYADQAMDLVAKSVQKGFRDGAFLKSDEFDVLRTRADFQRLLLQIEPGKK